MLCFRVQLSSSCARLKLDFYDVFMRDNDVSHMTHFSLLHNTTKYSVPIEHIFTPIKMQLVVAVDSSLG